MSTRGVLDVVPSSLITSGRIILNSLGKCHSRFEDQGFITPSISRLNSSNRLFKRIDLCSCLPLSSTRLGSIALTSSLLRLVLILDFLGRAISINFKNKEVKICYLLLL